MQRIERYGVLALVFLLVTVVTFALWDDGSKPGDVEVATAKPERRTQNQVQVQQRNRQSSTDQMRRNQGQGARTGNAARQQQKQRDDLAARQREHRNAAALAEQVRKQNGTGGTTRTNTPAVAQGQQPAKQSLQLGVAQKSGTTANSGQRPVNHNQVAANDTRQADRRRVQDQEAARREKQRNDRRRMDDMRRQKDHTVASGETLSHISVAHYGTASRWQDIAAANPDVNPNALRVGQKLVIPAGGKSVASNSGTQVAERKPAATKNTPRNSSSSVRGPGGSYIVKSGDVLSRIAQNEVGSASDVKRILAMNPGLDANRLVVGQVIALPRASSPSSGTVVAASHRASNSSNSNKARVR